MSRFVAAERAPPRIPPWPLLAVAAFVGLFHAVWWLLGDVVVVRGEFADGDSYARLLRVARLLETGDWLDSSLPRANAPFGGSLHWTRPFDVLLLAVALPLAPVLGFTKALFWSGVVVSPILHVLSALALAWAVTPLLGRAAACVSGALTATQLGIFGYATVGHADHHVLFVLITVLVLGFLVRVLATPEFRRADALAVGALLAMGLWVGPEMLSVLVLSMVASGLPWLAGERRAMARNIDVTLGLALGLALAVLVEHGPVGFGAVEYDRVSIVYLTLSLLLLGFWGGVCAGSRWMKRERGPAVRLVVALVGAVATGAVMRLLYPAILLGPLGGLDPGFLGLFDDISEFGAIDDVWRFLLYLGGAIFAVPWVAWRVKREWAGADRWAWILVGGALAVFVALSVAWVRATPYAGVFLAVALADLIARVDGAIAARLGGLAKTLAVVAAVVLLAVGPLAAGAGGLYAGNEGEEGRGRPCPVQEMTRFLDRPPWGERSRTILSSANFGPEILYRTGHKVLATLHHRNAAGIVDSVRILGGSDMAEARRLVRERRIDLIVLCPGSRGDGYLMGGDGERSLYRRLLSGDAPGWLRAVSLGDELEERFRLFEVTASP